MEQSQVHGTTVPNSETWVGEVSRPDDGLQNPIDTEVRKDVGNYLRNIYEETRENWEGKPINFQNCTPVVSCT